MEYMEEMTRDSVTINLPRTESTWTGWCFATLPGASQKRRHESEKSTLYKNSYGMMVYESEYYNMKLNKDICTYIAFNKSNKVTFRDGTPLKSVDTTTYLGTEIAKRAEPGLEISHRISLTMPVLKKLDLFWKQANVPKKWKLQVFQSVCVSKLLYIVSKRYNLLKQQRQSWTLSIERTKKNIKHGNNVHKPSKHKRRSIPKS